VTLPSFRTSKVVMSGGEQEYAMESGCLTLKCNVRDRSVEKEEEAAGDPILPYWGVDELEDKGKIVRATLSEFVGTLFLVLVGCGSCLGGDEAEAHVQLDDQAKVARISLCFGLTVATLTQTIGHVSGCHINPAVTLGLVVGRKLGVVKGAFYVLAHCLGAVTGAAILSAVVPAGVRGAEALGGTVVAGNVNDGQAVAIEMLITMVLLLVVFAVAADKINTATTKGSSPLAIGLAITACHMFAVPLTGSSMNPARSLGPAVVRGQWDHHWVYWVGPLLGGVLAAVLHTLVLRTRGPSGDEGRRGRQENNARRFVQKQRDSPPYQKSTAVGTSTNYLISTQ